MKSLIKTLVIIAILSSFNHVAFTEESLYYEHPFLLLSPQFGVDVGFTNINFIEERQHRMFATQQLPITGYFNINLNDKFGIEMGYTMPKKKRNTLMLVGRDVIPGEPFPVPVGEFIVYESYIETRQPYIGLKYDLHFTNHLPYLFGIIGFTSMKVRAQWEQIAGTDFDPNAEVGRKNFEFRKNIPFIKLGVYFPVPKNDHLQLRLATTWFKTSMLKKSTPAMSTITIRAKNTLHVSIGLAYII